MSRKPHDPIEPEVLPGAVPGHAITLREEAEVKATDIEMTGIAMRALGRMEALEFSATVADRARVEVYLELKQNKAYRALTIKDSDGNRRRVADLEEFCDHFLGKSAKRIREMAANYHLVGAELYEVSERIGFRNQDYRALKALPADDQEVIKQAIETDDRDTILSLMQELAAKHQSEKAALQAEAKEARETAAARDDVIKAKEDTISKLELRATTAERRKANFTDIEEAGYEAAPLHQAVAETIVGLKKIEREVARLTQEVGGELILEECYTAVLVAAKRALAINETYRLGIENAAVLGELSEDEREALEFRAMGVARPEATQ